MGPLLTHLPVTCISELMQGKRDRRPREGEYTLWLRILPLPLSRCTGPTALLSLGSSPVRQGSFVYSKGCCQEAPAHRGSSRDGAASSSPDAICQCRLGPSDHLSIPLDFHVRTSKPREEKFSQAAKPARTRISLLPGSSAPRQPPCVAC